MEQYGASAIRYHPVVAKRMLIPRNSVRGSKPHLEDFLKLMDSLDLDLANRTYSKKSLIMASIFGSKSKSFKTMSILPQDEPSTNQLVALSLPQDVPSTSYRRLIEIENQVQCLMEAHLAPK
ncbi:hypothetical protein Tco_1471367 [Tanacetum coccineum]